MLSDSLGQALDRFADIRERTATHEFINNTVLGICRQNVLCSSEECLHGGEDFPQLRMRKAFDNGLADLDTECGAAVAYPKNLGEDWLHLGINLIIVA